MSLLPTVVMTFATALALGVPAFCTAQMYRPGFSAEAAPDANLALSAAEIDSLNRELDDEVRALDSFGGGKRGIDRFPRGHIAAGGWKLYGRVFLVNFQNEIGNDEDRTRITWRRTGPRIRHSRLYIGIHRQF
jgi:hypothetical protein